MNNAKQIILSFSLAFIVPVSAMQSDMSKQKQWLINTMGVSEKNVTEVLLQYTEKSYGKYLDALACLNDPQGTKQTRSKAQMNLRKLKQEIRTEIDEAKFVVPNMQPEVQVTQVSQSQALVLYQDSAKVVKPTVKTIKPVVLDVSLACKLAQEMQSTLNRSSEALFSSIVAENQNNSLLSAPEQNLSPMALMPEVINVGQVIAQAIEEEGIILRDANGKIIAEVTEGSDTEGVEIEIPVDNLIPERAVDAENLLNEQEPLLTYSLNALKKPIFFGVLGVFGITALGWKLYQKTSHYQCGLLQKWQMQVADAIAGITSGNKQILPIEFSQLTRLTDVEREQLAQVHNSLVVAFDKAQQTVAQAVTDDVSHKSQVAVDHIPVVRELKVAHSQWDNVMNNCKNVVEQSSMRFW